MTNIQSEVQDIVAQAKTELQATIRSEFPKLYAGTLNLDQQWFQDPEWLTRVVS